MTENISTMALPVLVCTFVDCGSTVRRRAGNEGREELAGSVDTDNSEANKRSIGDMDEARRSPSPPPSIDSGQSG